MLGFVGFRDLVGQQPYYSKGTPVFWGCLLYQKKSKKGTAGLPSEVGGLGLRVSGLG